VGWRPDLQEEVQDARKPEAGRHGCRKHQEARLEVLPVEDGHCRTGQYLHWTKSRLSPQCWWCGYQNQTREHLLKECPEWRPQQKILWAEVKKGTGRWKSRWNIRDLLADGRCVRAVLDFLSSTDVGRLVPPLEEMEAGSEASEWELRERQEQEEERRAEAEGLGATGGLGSGRESPLVPPPPPSWHRQERSEGTTAVSALVLSWARSNFPLYFLWCALLSRGIGLGGGQRGACNGPPLRGQRTGNGLYIFSS
jgi:hypothetical protein